MKIRIEEERKSRPVMVQMMCAYQVLRILKCAHRLRQQQREFRTVYPTPDRTKEERAAHIKLVNEMKAKIQQDPSKYYYIRNGIVNITVKKTNTG